MLMLKISRGGKEGHADWLSWEDELKIKTEAQVRISWKTALKNSEWRYARNNMLAAPCTVNVFVV